MSLIFELPTPLFFIARVLFLSNNTHTVSSTDFQFLMVILFIFISILSVFYIEYTFILGICIPGIDIVHYKCSYSYKAPLRRIEAEFLLIRQSVPAARTTDCFIKNLPNVGSISSLRYSIKSFL